MQFVVSERKQGALRFSETIKFPDDYKWIRDGISELSLCMQNNYKKESWLIYENR